MTGAIVKYNLKYVFLVICDITEKRCGVNLRFNVDHLSGGVKFTVTCPGATLWQ